MDKWPSIAVAGGVAVTIAIHEFEHPGVVHLHQEQNNGPDQQIGRSAVEFAVTTGPLIPFVTTMDGNERRRPRPDASVYVSSQGETGTPLPMRFIR